MKLLTAKYLLTYKHRHDLNKFNHLTLMLTANVRKNNNLDK